MKRFLLLCMVIVAFLTTSVLAQERTISGRVTAEETGSPVPGVNVILKGTTIGTVTDIDGNYKLNVPDEGGILVYSFIGLATEEVRIGDQTVINMGMTADIRQLSEVVVTALGINRERTSLGYATQEVQGDEVTAVKDVNFMNSLSGKISGLQIKRSNQLGGSTNIVVRGYKSLTGNNQALFVVDGVVVKNSIINSRNGLRDQQTGRGGFDYGNTAMDINPEDIESINVLKGAAATALYGSRAANGVIVITTKKGKKGKGVGVTASFGTTFGTIDKDTFIRYQKEYGPGYSAIAGWYQSEYDPVNPDDPPGLEYFDFGNGPELITATYEDASYGPTLDPNLMVHDWRSLYPELSTYGQARPLVAAENDATSFYETSKLFNTHVAVSGGSNVANYRLSYTNMQQNGILPNSKIVRNTVSFSGGYEITNDIKISSSVNYSLTEGLGRYGTGYDNRNPNQSFRQWYQVTTDMVQQREAYESTGLNISWNPYGALDPGRATVPHYFDNYYFNRYENFNSDERNRIFGNFMVDYEIIDWLTLTGRLSTDRYSELREERIAVGSVDVSEYVRDNINFSEDNLDLFLRFDKQFGSGTRFFTLGGLLGANYRRTKLDRIEAQTNGGLVTPGVYSLSNSASNPEAPTETHEEVGVNGYFAQVNIGYGDILYLDVTGRYDIASTLPEENKSYFYPSASLAFVFSEMLNSSVISLGKIRVNYAEAGNLAGPLQVNDIYILNTPFAGVPLASASAIKRNPTLVSENTKSYEIGLEMNFLQNRLGFDVSVYQANSFNQIFQADVTAATGRRTDVVNAGEIQNKGIEASLRATPVTAGDFSWDINLNWTLNRNEVIELFGDQTNLQINSVQGGVTLNASVGEPFGTLRGTNYIFDNQGRPIVYPHWDSGVRFRKTASPETIGNINPDWYGGIQNILSYKGLRLSFLIDIQKGGNFFSLDNWYGYATGVYDITAGVNKDGNPRRDRPSDGGGIYLSELDYLDFSETVTHATDENGDYVYDDEGNPVGSGELNTEAFYESDVYSSIGYVYAPNAFHIYDASYVKLRELTLTYSLPSSLLDSTPLQAIDLSLIGRNLWILSKKSPYSDPEAGLSAGNDLGNQSGAYPAVKEIGFNVSVTF